MDKENKTKADQHDHNDHLPKDVLNLAQDPDSFRDPLQQQLEKSGENPGITPDAHSEGEDKKPQ